MAYFDSFPYIQYTFNVNGKKIAYTMRDITLNVRLIKQILANVALYDEYDIEDGETPDLVSIKLYGDPQYFWVIMLANDKFNPIADFPLTQPQLLQYVTDQYGAGNEYNVHHYELDGYVVNEDEAGAEPVSNFDQEDRLNEAKRRIKVISPQLLSMILSNLSNLIAQ